MNKRRIKLTESDLHRIVNESVKRVLRESGDDTRKQEVEEYVADNGGEIQEWLSDNYFYDTHGCNGSIFGSEDEAEESIMKGEDHQNALDMLDGLIDDDEMVKFLRSCGVDILHAKRMVKYDMREDMIEPILNACGAKFFLSGYSGEVHELSDGTLLYY